MWKLKIRKIGDALGVILPREILSKMRLKEGDKIFLTESEDGGYKIIPRGPEFEKQMKIARGIMSRYRNTLRQLATD